MSYADPSLAPDALPPVLPIFPLGGALLLPRGRLPLNIFEPRYLAMVEDALGTGRMIGMIQPRGNGAAGGAGDTVGNGLDTEATPVYPMGCAGRISAFRESGDGRFLITLTGVSRFRVAEELPMHRGYRKVVPLWTEFEQDLVEAESADIDRSRLVAGLRGYFRRHRIECDWRVVEATPDERLITTLAMICPFDANEKQALLEAPDLTERGRLLIALIEMACLDMPDGDGAVRH